MTKASKVTIDNLAGEIALAIAQYTEDVSAAIEAELAATANMVLQDIKAALHKPKHGVDTGKYRRGWRIRREQSEGGKVRFYVHQSAKPQLSHLLEFGHATVQGERVSGIPHIRPAYDKHVPLMHERVKRLIEEWGQ